MIGKEIVRKCKGVPLAIRTLASILFSKHEVKDWESLRDHEIWNLSQKNDDILPALKLSYDQMPSYLRKCFAVFSLFPKDFEFQSYHIDSLWRAADEYEKMNSTLRLKTLFFSKVVNFPHSLQGYANTLQTLGFVWCYELEVLPEWVWNITCLKFLHIWSCPKLMSLPNDIHRLTALEILRIEDCPELYRKYQPHVGEYWHQISHIKHCDIRKTRRRR
ncbi:hypothetical protein PIB30_086095 [Stylosanthes scabra]|uniref:NB-ARC domain-containing protein n=1 Tax=Stylosanthes scabra TaxID=79078 RepID=A0ABU6VV07_9FABA|nr:hypothetical protein [Stylosanthes scabra]